MAPSASNRWQHLKTSTTKRYYQLAGTTVAVRDNIGAGSLNYLLGDQLGSTTIAANASTGVVATQRFLPYGAPRVMDTYNNEIGLQIGGDLRDQWFSELFATPQPGDPYRPTEFYGGPTRDQVYAAVVRGVSDGNFVAIQEGLGSAA